MTQFMTAAEQVEHGHTARGEPTYAELQAINADLLAALEQCQRHFRIVPNQLGAVVDAAIAKAKGETPCES